MNVHGKTIPHEVIGLFGAAQIILKPASEGTGVIAGGATRVLLELVGIKDVLSKKIGRNETTQSFKGNPQCTYTT